MKVYTITLFIILIITGCETKENKTYIEKVDWTARSIAQVDFEGHEKGRTYLPVYAQIYHIKESRKYDLTVTVSMRNTSLTDTLFLSKADYYNTAGEKIRSYITQPVFLSPMETLEIVIEDADVEGGSGANFIFDWAINGDSALPLFEAVMITSEGQQGISFTTRGVTLNLEQEESDDE